jgi:hypothetical protein
MFGACAQQSHQSHSSSAQVQEDPQIRQKRIEGWKKLRKGMTPAEVAALIPIGSNDHRSGPNPNKDHTLLTEFRDRFYFVYTPDKNSGGFTLSQWSCLPKSAYPELFPKEAAQEKAFYSSAGSSGILGWGLLKKGMTVQEVSSTLHQPEILEQWRYVGFGSRDFSNGSTVALVVQIRSLGNVIKCKFVFDKDGLVEWKHGV